MLIRTKPFIKKYLEDRIPGMYISGHVLPEIEHHILSVIQNEALERMFSPIRYEIMMEVQLPKAMSLEYGRRLSSGQEMKINMFISKYIHHEINILVDQELKGNRKYGAFKQSIERIVRKGMGIDHDMLEDDALSKSFQRYRKKHELDIFIYEKDTE